MTAPPPTAPVTTGGYAYPDGGAVLSVLSSNAAAGVDADGKATATSGVTGLTVFGGEVTADAVLGRAAAAATASGAVGDFDGTAAQNLQVLGAAAVGARIPLADWGTLTVGGSTVDRSESKDGARYGGTVAGLEIVLTADHGGLPAGSRIQIGTATAGAEYTPPAPEPETVPTTTATTPSTTTTTAEPKPSTVAAPTDTTPATTTPEPG